ncbi:MAG: hypothetical protein KKD92_08400 [Proteobacteria bacterium]|nr:hypothetical protein [Pseudomonadota bacterium]
MKDDIRLAQLCQYYYEVLSRGTRDSGLVNISSKNSLTLLPFPKNEPLLSNPDLECTFKVPRRPIPSAQHDALTENDASVFFSRLLSLYNKYAGDQNAFDWKYGLLSLAGKSQKDESHKEGPLLLVNCEIEYDIESDEIRVVVTDDKPRLNTSLLFELLDENTANIVHKQLLPSLPDLPLSPDSINNFLDRLAHVIKGLRYTPITSITFQAPTGSAEGKTATFDAILFLAKKANYFVIQDLAAIAERAEEASGTALVQLVQGPPEDTPKDTNTDATIKVDSLEHFFPKPWNLAQERVAKHIMDGKLISVTGPPGTGKTHAIANLVCHLVAKGKTVLVSSEKNQALVVLAKEHLGPLKFNYLHKTLLKNSAASKRELVREIENSITYKQALNPERISEAISRLSQEIKRTKIQIERLKGEFSRLTQLEQDFGLIFKEYASLREKYDKIADPTPLSDDHSFKQALLKLISHLCTLRDIAPTLEILYRTIPDISVNNYQEYSSRVNSIISLRKEQLAACSPTMYEQWKQYLQTTNNSAALQALENYLRENEARFADYYEAYHFLKNAGVENLGRFSKERFLSEKDLLPKRALLEQTLEEIEWLAKNHESVRLIHPTDRSQIEILLGEYSKWENRFWGVPFRWFLRRKLRKIPSLSALTINSDTISTLRQGIKGHILLQKVEKVIKHDLSFLLLSETLSNLAEITAIGLARVRQINKTLFDFYVFDLSIREAVRKHADPQTFIERLWEQESLQAAKEYINCFLGSIRYKYLEIEIDRSVSHGGLSRLYAEFLDNCLLQLADQQDSLPLRNLMAAISAVPLQQEVSELKDILRTFPNTLHLVCQNCDSHRDTELAFWVDNIDAIIKAKTRRDKIETVNSENRQTPGRIAEQIRELDSKVLKLIRQYIQQQIDNHLYHSLEQSRVVTEILRFANLVRRNKRNVTSFEEMKEEIDFSALLSVFPCWIMTLEDVARWFLISKSKGLFDYVIIDEASQCHLGAALPALYKAKCAIVVGDDKQLPSASLRFFPDEVHREIFEKTGMHKVRYGNYFHIKDYSLFDLAELHAGKHRTTLVEHFRSYPEIVNYCNEKYYKNLVIMTHLKSLGFNLRDQILNIIRVNDAVEINKINEKEAEAILNHIQALLEDSRYAGKSIGVISVFQEQASYIWNLIQQRFSPSLIQQYNLLSGTADSFQGDERDIIIYSWRKAPNSPHGSFNFVGEGRPEGQKRWNVALSRAREQIYCFISDEIESFSPIVREYLRYVQDPSSLKLDTEPFDSGFEKNIYDDLTNRSLVVYPQFKSCGFRIDLVITDNKRHYLAVECDGYPYHYEDGKLKESDVQRQRVLERAGWTVKRICSRDYYSEKRDQIINEILQYFGRD